MAFEDENLSLDATQGGVHFLIQQVVVPILCAICLTKIFLIASLTIFVLYFFYLEEKDFYINLKQRFKKNAGVHEITLKPNSIILPYFFLPFSFAKKIKKYPNSVLEILRSEPVEIDFSEIEYFRETNSFSFYQSLRVYRGGYVPTISLHLKDRQGVIYLKKDDIGSFNEALVQYMQKNLSEQKFNFVNKINNILHLLILSVLAIAIFIASVVFYKNVRQDGFPSRIQDMASYLHF